MLGVSRSNRSSSSNSMPSPYNLLQRATSPSMALLIRSGMSDSSSVTETSAVESSVSTQTEPANILGQTSLKRDIRKRARKKDKSMSQSGARSRMRAFTADEKLGRNFAALVYIATTCREDCIPSKSKNRDLKVTESILQANAAAPLEGRSAITSDKAMCDSVSPSFH